jgi:hypothetical protein
MLLTLIAAASLVPENPVQAFSECATRRAQIFEPSSEPAATIAEVAVGKCHQELSTAEQWLAEKTGLIGLNRPEQIRLREGNKEILSRQATLAAITKVVEIRANRKTK